MTVQDVQTVPIVQIVLNGAKRLNSLNVWNFKGRKGQAKGYTST